ncbi:hypothetical protein [Pseudomonas putida]
MNKQAGFALIISIWALALLSLLSLAVLGAIRLESRQSNYELRHACGVLKAEAGLAIVLSRVLAGANSGLNSTSNEIDVDFEGVKLKVVTFSELGKVDLNSGGLDDIGSVARFVGATDFQVRKLLSRMSQIRREGSAFQALEQLKDVPGMDEVLYRRLEKNVTIWSGLLAPDPSLALPDVRTALGFTGIMTSLRLGPVITISSEALFPDGFSSYIQATIYLTPNSPGRQLYRVLRWKEG